MAFRLDITSPCSAQSLASGEPIGGTATAEVDAWLLIEHRGRWERDIANCDLPAAASRWLTEMGARHRRLRTQLIQRRHDNDGGPVRVFVVIAGSPGTVRRFEIENHEQLPDIDLDGLLSGERDAGMPGPDSLYLVCTHGRRDRCCAMHGLALVRTLQETELDGELWQSSHQGGHRFAATMLYLPAGVHYGRLVPEDAEMVAAAHRRGEIFDLSRYRGQTRYSRAVQTAEAWLRIQLNATGFDDVTFRDASAVEGSWVARFTTLDETLHHVTVELREGDVARKLSCDAEDVAVPSYYDVVRHAAEMT